MSMHGGDILSVADACDIDPSKILDFSVNINPYGISETILDAVKEAIPYITKYPDPKCRNLRKKLSKQNGISDEYIICGNGAADIIYRIVFGLKPRKTLLVSPTFSEYESALKIIDSDIAYYSLGQDLELKEDYLTYITDKIDMLFLCTPNNPTGLIPEKNLIDDILCKAKQTGTIVVADECFLDFVNDGEKISLRSKLLEYKNLIIIKSFTKLYAIPGIRLGYGMCSDIQKLEKIATAGQTWSVNSLALVAGEAAIDILENSKKHDLEYAEFLKDISEQRNNLKKELIDIGLEVWDGQANYLLFRADGISDLKERMLRSHILIRSCSDYLGLSKFHYRVAVKNKTDNNKLIYALKQEVIKKQ